jgi:carboxymethylenebutenolidase
MNIFQNYLVEEFAEDYQEGHLTRREALKLIAGVTGSLVVATTILSACAPPETATPGIATARLGTETPAGNPAGKPATQTPTPTENVIEIVSGDASPTQPLAQSTLEAGAVEITPELRGYLARPAGEGPFPVILVCHENRGLTPHIEDVTRRLAQAGYVALAVDLLSRSGGTASLDPSDVPGILGNTSPDQFVADFLSGWEYLKTLPYTNPQRVGMVGFCFGGGVTWLMATRMPELLAAVPFYGPHPPLEDVPNIQAAVLGIYAGNDQRINQGIPGIEQAMVENNKVFEKIIYPGVDHAFHNDTSSRYNAEAATDAWMRTLDWFERYVKINS